MKNNRISFKDTNITLRSLNNLSALSNRAYIFDLSPRLKGFIKVIIDKRYSRAGWFKWTYRNMNKKRNDC